MDVVKLTIRLTAEYREQVSEAQEIEALRKCRSWVDLLEPTDKNIAVELNGTCIILRCNTRNGLRQESCTYGGVLAVTEMKDGILLRLSHKRLLWLPVSDEPQENERLMDAVILLCTYCKYHFRIAKLRLKKVGIAKRILFCVKTRRGLYTGSLDAKIAIGLFICLAFFVGTVFVSQVFQNQRIQRQDATVLNAEFIEADPSYGRNMISIRYIDLLFKNAEEQTVDGCCLGYGLKEKLESLPSGTEMQLLTHPKSGNVLEIQVGNNTLLEFEFAQERLWNESLVFMALGVFMYAVSVGLLVKMFWKKRK